MKRLGHWFSFLLPKSWRRAQILKQINRRLFEIGESYRPLIEKAKNAEEREDLGRDRSYQACELEDHRDQLETDWRLEEARGLGIPIPEEPRGEDVYEDENWYQQPAGRSWVLKPEGHHKLRAAIRQEKKERRDYWLGWLPLISALTGLIGTLTGLVAWLFKR